ncbi:MAG: hypothetical protein JWN07_3408 [Hyphomicrobiales bacterium]|nr:hypothetical protein [Hyphomicrobiales bacterium]
MAGFSSVKLSADFVDEARSEARQLHRSVAGQIEYWARLGRAAEAVMPIAKVREALSSGVAFDDLSAEAKDTLLYDLATNAGVPTPESEAFFAERREKGLGVGMANGKLVRALPGGKMEEITLSRKD